MYIISKLTCTPIAMWRIRSISHDNLDKFLYNWVVLAQVGRRPILLPSLGSGSLCDSPDSWLLTPDLDSPRFHHQIGCCKRWHRRPSLSERTTWTVWWYCDNQTISNHPLWLHWGTVVDHIVPEKCDTNSNIYRLRTRDNGEANSIQSRKELSLSGRCIY